LEQPATLESALEEWIVPSRDLCKEFASEAILLEEETGHEAEIELEVAIAHEAGNGHGAGSAHEARRWHLV
jgi:hypothetical protein